MRFNQGKGPIKIAIDLKQRGIENFDLSAYDFFTIAKATLSFCSFKIMAQKNT
jgi:regulatory protein